MQDCLVDLRRAVRRLVGKPGFATASIGVLALGIGVNTAIFSVVHAALFAPLPYPDPDRLVRVYEANPSRGWEHTSLSLHDFRDFEERARGFALLAAFNAGSLNISGQQGPERVDYARVTARFFSVLGVTPLLGRTFQDEDDQPGMGNVVVIRRGFWQRYFGGRADVVGQTLTADNSVCTVIGVVPDSTSYPGRTVELWKPIAMRPEATGDRDGRWLSAIARLEPGASLPDARAGMARIAADLAVDYPKSNEGWTVRLVPLQQDQSAGSRTGLLMLWGAVGLVLLVACANVANLTMARSEGRRAEIALRRALGAGRWQIVRHLFAESVVISLAGGATGLLLARWGLPLLSGLSAVTVLVRPTLDTTVLVYTLAVAVLTAFVFGLIPALSASRKDLYRLIKARRTATSGRFGHAGALLVVGEIALTVMLLVGAGLLIRSFAAVLEVGPGFDPDGMLTLRVAPPQAERALGEAPASFGGRLADERRRMVELYRDLTARVRTLPGVASAGVVNRPPLAGDWWGLELEVEGGNERGRVAKAFVLARVVDAGYLPTVGVPLLQGRQLTDQDTESAPRVGLVSQTAARRYWPNEDPIGRRLLLRRGLEPISIVGVVGDVRYSGLEREPDPTLYIPFPQAVLGHFGDWGMTLVVRSNSSPVGLAPAVRRIVRSLDSTLPVFEVGSMDQVIGRVTEGRRTQMMLLALFAALALILASVGIYSVLSCVVSRSTRDIGIRMALGADAALVLRQTLGRGIKLIVVGVLAGWAGAAALGRVTESLLFGIRPLDPATWTGVTLLLVVVALAACWFPAHRAARVDPIAALKHL